MSALDELRRKADEKKAAELQDVLNEKLLELTYQSDILPKMQILFDTFNETVNHLNFLEEPITVNNYCPRFPQFGNLFQKNYKINTDGRMGFADYNRILEINLSFVLEAKGEFSYPVVSKSLVEKEIEFLQAKKLVFDWKYMTPKDGKVYANFTVKRSVPVSFRIEAVYNESLLRVTILNHENLELYTKDFLPEQLDDHFADMLLNYFLRKDNRLLVAMGELTDRHKSAVRAAVQNNVAGYHQEQAELLNKIKFEEQAELTIAEPAKKLNFVKNIFSKFQK